MEFKDIMSKRPMRNDLESEPFEPKIEDKFKKQDAFPKRVIKEEEPEEVEPVKETVEE